MSTSVLIPIYLLLAFLSANLPWLSERRFFLFETDRKSPWTRLAEWLGLYFLVGLVGLGMEYKLNGELHPQDWEFYAVTLSLFFVLAIPGFIWRFDWKRH